MAITISGSGIVEANLADNAVTLAKMASGTDGEILTYDASGNPVAVSVGTDGQVLTSTGSTTPPAFEAAAGGKVLQIQNGVKTGYTTINSTTYADIGLSVTITPSLTTSTILLMVDLGNLWRSSTSQSKFQAQLLRGSTSIRVLTTTTGHLDLANEISSSYSGSHIDSPSTTSATTYKIQGKVNVTGTFTVNYTGGIQSITAFEIGA